MTRIRRRERRLRKTVGRMSVKVKERFWVSFVTRVTKEPIGIDLRLLVGRERMCEKRTCLRSEIALCPIFLRLTLTK